jgi:hypothetical protein
MPTKTKGEFSVIQWFREGYSEFVKKDVGAEEAVLTAKGVTESPGALLGIPVRVIITDGEDFTVFEWKHGEGVVFPTREQCEAMKEVKA